MRVAVLEDHFVRASQFPFFTHGSLLALMEERAEGVAFENTSHLCCVCEGKSTAQKLKSAVSDLRRAWSVHCRSGCAYRLSPRMQGKRRGAVGRFPHRICRADLRRRALTTARGWGQSAAQLGKAVRVLAWTAIFEGGVTGAP